MLVIAWKNKKLNNSGRLNPRPDNEALKLMQELNDRFKHITHFIDKPITKAVS